MDVGHLPAAKCATLIAEEPQLVNTDGGLNEHFVPGKHGKDDPKRLLFSKWLGNKPCSLSI